MFEITYVVLFVFISSCYKTKTTLKHHEIHYVYKYSHIKH